MRVRSRMARLGLLLLIVPAAVACSHFSDDGDDKDSNKARIMAPFDTSKAQICTLTCDEHAWFGVTELNNDEALATASGHDAAYHGGQSGHVKFDCREAGAQ